MLDGTTQTSEIEGSLTNDTSVFKDAMFSVFVNRDDVLRRMN